MFLKCKQLCEAVDINAKVVWNRSCLDKLQLTNPGKYKNLPEGTVEPVTFKFSNDPDNLRRVIGIIGNSKKLYFDVPFAPDNETQKNISRKIIIFLCQCITMVDKKFLAGFDKIQQKVLMDNMEFIIGELITNAQQKILEVLMADRNLINPFVERRKRQNIRLPENLLEVPGFLIYLSSLAQKLNFRQSFFYVYRDNYLAFGVINNIYTNTQELKGIDDKTKKELNLQKIVGLTDIDKISAEIQFPVTISAIAEIARLSNVKYSFKTEYDKEKHTTVTKVEFLLGEEYEAKPQ